MRLRSVALLALFAAIPAAPQQPRFGEKIEVRLVEVDVVVTDKAGNRIHGLISKDFEVFEGRRAQTITNFTEYSSDGTVRPTPAPTVSVPQPRTLLILIDWLPRTGFVRSTVVEKLQPLIGKVMRPGDRASVVYWEPVLQRFETLVEPTTDRTAVIAAIRALDPVHSGQALAEGEEFAQEQLKQAMEEKHGKDPGVDVMGNLEASARAATEAEIFRLRRKTAAIRRLVGSLATASGKKSLLYVADSFAIPADPDVRSSAILLIDQVAQAANAGRVTFYAIQPVAGDMEVVRHLDALNRLTEPTGGAVDSGLRAIESVGENLAADLDSYYSIAYRAQSDGRDRERRIVVRVKNPAYRVRTRKAVMEKSNETVAREMLLTRLFSDDDGGDVRFKIDQGQPKWINRDQWVLPIIVRIPVDQLQFAPENGAQVAHVKILIAAANGVAEVTNVNERDLRVVAGRDTPGGFINYSVEILGDRRGSKVSIGALDQRTGLAGVRTIDNRGRFR